jgi:hypothetical protein
MHYLENGDHLALATRDINECILCFIFATDSRLILHYIGLRLEPQSAAALANRAAIRLATDHFDLAEEDCRLACTLEPQSAAPHAHLAGIEC